MLLYLNLKQYLLVQTLEEKEDDRSFLILLYLFIYLGPEAELEEEETDVHEKRSSIDESSQKSAFQTEMEQIPDSFLPVTPLRPKRYNEPIVKF